MKCKTFQLLPEACTQLNSHLRSCIDNQPTKIHPSLVRCSPIRILEMHMHQLLCRVPRWQLPFCRGAWRLLHPNDGNQIAYG